MAEHGVNLHPKVVKYIEDLISTGLYGSNFSDVVERLVCCQIQELIEAGILELKE